MRPRWRARGLGVSVFKADRAQMGSGNLCRHLMLLINIFHFVCQFENVI